MVAAVAVQPYEEWERLLRGVVCGHGHAVCLPGIIQRGVVTLKHLAAAVGEWIGAGADRVEVRPDLFGGLPRAAGHAAGHPQAVVGQPPRYQVELGLQPVRLALQAAIDHGGDGAAQRLQLGTQGPGQQGLGGAQRAVEPGRLPSLEQEFFAPATSRLPRRLAQRDGEDVHATLVWKRERAQRAAGVHADGLHPELARDHLLVVTPVHPRVAIGELEHGPFAVRGRLTPVGECDLLLVKSVFVVESQHIGEAPVLAGSQDVDSAVVAVADVELLPVAGDVVELAGYLGGEQEVQAGVACRDHHRARVRQVFPDTAKSAARSAPDRVGPEWVMLSMAVRSAIITSLREPGQA